MRSLFLFIVILNLLSSNQSHQKHKSIKKTCIHRDIEIKNLFKQLSNKDHIIKQE